MNSYKEDFGNFEAQTDGKNQYSRIAEIVLIRCRYSTGYKNMHSMPAPAQRYSKMNLQTQ